MMEFHQVGRYLPRRYVDSNSNGIAKPKGSLYDRYAASYDRKNLDLYLYLYFYLYLYLYLHLYLYLELDFDLDLDLDF